MESSEALSALDAKRQAEVQMARAAACPPWRHVLFGVLMGGMIASVAFNTAIKFAILIGVLCLIPIIIHSDRKRMGMFINGYRRGKTRVVSFGVLIVELSLYFMSVWRGLDLHDHWTPLLLGVVGFAIGAIGSKVWQNVFVREMGA